MEMIKNKEEVTKQKRKQMNLRGQTYLKFIKYLKIKDEKLIDNLKDMNFLLIFMKIIPRRVCHGAKISLFNVQIFC